MEDSGRTTRVEREHGGSAVTRSRRLSRFVAVLCSTAIALGVAEIFVRATGEVDEDGAFSWRGLTVWPTPLPIARHDELMEPLRAAKEPRLVYHEKLGWSPNPNADTFQQLYYTNADGIRTDEDRARYAPQKREGVTRIVLVGDSFTYCDEISFEPSWGHQLELALKEKGRSAEVINLGVSGFGMDQALLRFRENGKQLAPDFVVLGLRPENAARNLSVVRLFYKQGSKIPYTKPRFVLEESGELRLLNSPAMSPEQLNQRLHDGTFRDWEPLRFDVFAAPYLATARPWHQSRVAALVERLSFPGVPDPDHITFDPDGEPIRLALGILRAFDVESKEIGAQFIALHLSTKSKGKLDPLVVAAQEQFETIDTTEVLRKELKKVGAPLIRKNGSHYTEEACAIIGTFVAERLLDLGN